MPPPNVAISRHMMKVGKEILEWKSFQIGKNFDDVIVMSIL